VDLQNTSQLVRIEKLVFVWSNIIWLTVPAGVEFLDGKAFEDCHIQKLGIETGHRYFEMQGDFLVGVVD
jgi:hypothetical protein